jgi:membrane protein YdbS with pleckstrin-like domain
MFKGFSIFTKSSYTFEGENAYEQTLALMYRHWYVLVGQMIGFVLVLVLPFILLAFGGAYLERWGLMSFVGALLWIYYLVAWYRLFYVFTMYLLDVWVVTDHRIIDSQQEGYFNRAVAETSLSKVQDVHVHIQGIIQTFFDFGDVEVQTAGTQERFIFRQVPHPNQVKDLIMQAQRDFIANHRGDGGDITHDHTT